MGSGKVEMPLPEGAVKSVRYKKSFGANIKNSLKKVLKIKKFAEVG
jgi:hypothetical protein